MRWRPARASFNPKLPSFVDVTFVNAMIGPAKASGDPWDGMTPPSPDVIQHLSALLDVADPYPAIASVMAGPVLQGFVPPEPFGNAQLLGVPQSLGGPRKITSENDTFTPEWQGETTWSRVPLSSGVRLHVQLIDDDISNDDPIGS